MIFLLRSLVPRNVLFFYNFSSFLPQTAENFFHQFHFHLFFNSINYFQFILCVCGMYASLRLNLYFSPFVFEYFPLNLFLGRSAEWQSPGVFETLAVTQQRTEKGGHQCLIELKCVLRSLTKRTEGYYCSLLDLGAFLMADFV